MSDTFTTIQTKVRELAREGDLNLATAELLALTNWTYRTMSAMTKWPELRRVIDFTQTTTIGTQGYDFPISSVFQDITGVQIQDPHDKSKYKLIPFTKSELEWNLASNEDDGWPRMALMQNDGTNQETAFAPAPETAGLTIQAIGYIEPTELAVGSDTTVWYATTADDAFAHLIAANRQAKKNDVAHAQFLLGRARTFLTPLIGRDVTIEELRERGFADA